MREDPCVKWDNDMYDSDATHARRSFAANNARTCYTIT